MVLALAAALYVGVIRLDQTRPAMVQTPAFHADVGRVTMGSQERTLTVPTIGVEKPAGNTQAPR